MNDTRWADQGRAVATGPLRDNKVDLADLALPVQPPVRSLTSYADAYAPSLASMTPTIVAEEADPVRRAKGFLWRVSALGGMLAVMTLALLVLLSWLNVLTLGGVGIFLFWLMVASLEFTGAFLALSMADYDHSAAGITRQQVGGVLRLMEREQAARLRHLYREDIHVDRD